MRRIFTQALTAALVLAAPHVVAASRPGAALALLRAAPAASRFPDAGVYWLRQEVTVTLHADGTCREDHHETARVFNERGMAAADVKIPYSADSQAVTDVQARTIRPDGSVTPLDPADIHQTSPYSDFTEYNDLKDVAFSLPGVEENAILDYRYAVVTRRPLRRGRYADAEWLAGSDPGRLFRYTLVAPASLPLRFRTHNAPHVRFTERLSADGRRRVLRWDNRDVPEVTEEPAMPPQETYAPWVEVSDWPAWSAVARWYQGLASPRMAATPAMAAFAARLTAGRTTESAKAKALFYWVERRTRYVAVEEGVSAYQPHAAAAVWRDRYGDCKDMATLLVSLLHAAGIRAAWPALLDTESKLPRHGLLATPDLFDHVIVRAQLDGQPFWFDATAEFCPFGEIPGGDRGLEAFVVRPGGGAFETIPWGGPGANRVVYRKDVTLHPDGSAECRASVQDDGDPGLSDRARFLALTPGQRAAAGPGLIGGPLPLSDTFVSAVAGEPDPSSLRVAVGPCADPDTPMTYRVDYRTPAAAVRTGPLLILTDGFSFAPPVDPPRRRFPLFIDGDAQAVYVVTVTLPPGYAVAALPDDVREDTPAGTVGIAYTAGPGTLTVRKVLTLRHGVTPPSAYPQLRAAMERAALLEKRPIVLQPPPAPPAGTPSAARSISLHR